MKSAKAADAWRRVIKSERGFRLRRLRAISKPPLADFDEELSNGLTILCGLNGVGKTTLLRLVEGAFAGAGTVAGRCRPDALASGSFLVDVEHDGNHVELALETDAEETPPAVNLLDAFEDCGRLLRTFSQPNFEDLLEGVDPREYTPEERAHASYAVGRLYDVVKVYEIEEPGTDEDTLLPYFGVSAGGTTYASPAMGLGELAALLTLWNLDRVDPGSILLIEEPETFLSSRSTVALMDVIAERVHEQRLYAIVTTHSLEIVARVPLETVRLLSTTTQGVAIRRPSSRAELEQLLGAYLGQSREVLVEDRTARLFLGELISRYSGIWGQSIEILQAGGVTPILTVCRDFPKSEEVRIVGVRDADQTDALPVDLQWPVVNLPGEGSPDDMLRAAALNNIELFSSRLDRPKEAVELALAQVAGHDAHDWFPDLAGLLALDVSAVVRAAASCWLAVGGQDVAAKEFVEELARLLVD